MDNVIVNIVIITVVITVAVYMLSMLVTVTVTVIKTPSHYLFYSSVHSAQNLLFSNLRQNNVNR